MKRFLSPLRLLLAVALLALTSQGSHAAHFDPSVFAWSNNSYTYQNGLGSTLTGQSILVEGINLEWLPLNFTTNYSFDEINMLTQSGEIFAGWRLATDSEVRQMLDTYFTDIVLDLSDSSNDPLKNDAFSSFYPFFGDTYSPLVTEPGWWEYGFGYAIGFYDEVSNDPYPQYASALIFSDAHYNLEPTYLDGDILYIFHGYGTTEKYDSIGSYLVRETAVPIPASVWLFGTGLLGLIGMARRRLPL